MAKFYGKIGYVKSVENTPGVWIDESTERTHYGDLLENNTRWQDGGQLNDNLALNNRISIIADPFANANFHRIRYVNWMGSYWEVSNVKIQRPRIILTIGGVYNGIKAETP